MPPVVYASFVEIGLAERACGALLDHGVRPSDLSLVSARIYQTPHQASYGASAGVSMDPSTTWIPDTDVVRADRNDMLAEERSRLMEAEVRVNPVHRAQHGVSVTTGGDARAGAVRGAEVGLGLGVLGGLAALLVPGFGLVLGGGALALALAAAAGTTLGGALAGAVTGYLIDQGVPDAVAERYESSLVGGGAVLAISLGDEASGRLEIERLLIKYGATNIHTYEQYS